MKRARPSLTTAAAGALALLTCLICAACAPPRDPWGIDAVRGRAAEIAVPESLQAEISVQPNEPGAFPFTTRLYARPRKTEARAYRLDAFGFGSAILASYRWQGGEWLFVRHDERRYWEGKGNGLEVEGAPLSLPDVHAVLGFAWGELLPGFSGAPPAEAGIVRWTYAGEPWEAEFDPATGACREARSPSLRIRYAIHKLRQGRALPEQAEIFVEGKLAVTLRLRGVEVAPSWRKNPFVLPVPPAYSPGTP